MPPPSSPANAAEARPGADARATPLVVAQQLSKYFVVGGRAPTLSRAVSDVSFEVPRAGSVGIVGESGCGKTTLARLSLRLIEPSYGRVVFDGVDLMRLHERELRPLRRRMQILFEDAVAALDARLRVGDLVAEPLRIHGLTKARAVERERVAELLARTGLPPTIVDERGARLSAGQARLVGIARALATDPAFLVCDEVEGGLDRALSAHVLELLLSLRAERELALMLVSHDIRFAITASEVVHVMYAGRIVESASAEELSYHALHPYTRALLSAAPSPDPRRRRLRLVLEGEPPSPFEPPPGCAFHPRCPRARPGVCDRDAPPLERVGRENDAAHRQVACWYPHQ